MKRTWRVRIPMWVMTQSGHSDCRVSRCFAEIEKGAGCSAATMGAPFLLFFAILVSCTLAFGCRIYCGKLKERTK
jgi:hypothetical protein